MPILFAGKYMKKQYRLILLAIIATIFIYGCNSQINLAWEEFQGCFYTTDLDRAQGEIPFTILLPTYLPDSEQKTIRPSIDGPLAQFQSDNEIEVNVKYGFDLGYDLPGIILITESNYPLSLGDPELNPELERVEIEGISIIKTKEDWSPGSDAYYSFSSNNIYYVVEIHNLPNEESNKIVNSMIIQITSE